MKEANRLKRLPPYLFTIVDNIKDEVRAQGVDVIDLSMGNPDLPTPPNIVEELRSSVLDPANHRYSKRSEPCETDLRQAIADWYKQRFDVTLDPATEIVPLIGSKEGIAHLSTAFLNPDDIALVPSPGYPVHFNGVIMAGGILYNLPLYEENDYLPDLTNIPPDVLKRSKLMFVSYPNNPTSAVVELPFYDKMVAWAKEHNIILASDLAYSDIVFDGYKAPSVLQAKDARDVAIEFHSLSKSYSMAGWRLGFAVGNAKILSSLEKTKSYTDFGIFRGIQRAAIEALTGDQSSVHEFVDIYQSRLKFFVNGLNNAGWPIPMPKATFYVWAKIPAKYSGLSSLEFSSRLLRETGVAVSPGNGFGEYGEGYVRMALVQNEKRLGEAIERIHGFIDIKS